MRVIRTEQIFIRDNGEISKMCHLSKNLFNQANYIIRNQFFKKEKISSYKTLANEFSEASSTDTTVDY